jgi:tetratricopeptide (TPR) repeat protein
MMIFFIFILSLLVSCAEKNMTLEEAKQISVSMSDKSFVPPPRRINDILALLDQPGEFDRDIIAELNTKAIAEPPETDDPETLAEFYFSRGFSAHKIGRYLQSLEDLKLSNHYKENYLALNILSTVEAFLGNYEIAIAHIKRAMELKKVAPQFYMLAYYQSSIGDFQACETTVNEGLSFIDRRTPGSSGQYLDWLIINRNRIIATLFHAKELFTEAEPYRRKTVKILKRNIKKWPDTYVFNKGLLDMNLAYQGRMIEAELGARETLKEAIGLYGPGGNPVPLINLGKILLMKTGRVEEAMGSIADAYASYQQYLGANHYQTAEMLGLRGMAFALMEKDNKAIKDFSMSIPILFKDKPEYGNHLINLRLKVI